MLGTGGLKIFQLNVCSLYSRLDEIRHYLSDSSIDIIGFSESSLSPSISDNEVHIDGFSLYRCDRIERLRGGVAVYVRSNLSVTRRLDIESEKIESVWLEIHQENCKSILLGFVYRPPSSLVSWARVHQRVVKVTSVVFAGGLGRI